jgi:hypothetical protein
MSGSLAGLAVPALAHEAAAVDQLTSFSGGVANNSLYQNPPSAEQDASTGNKLMHAPTSSLIAVL